MGESPPNFDMVNLMWGYVYIYCDKCGNRLKIRIGQKTRLCPYCGKTVTTAGKQKKKV